MTKSLNLSFNLSLGFHIAFFGFYIFLVSHSNQTQKVVISDVDLLVPMRHKIKSMAQSPSPARPKTTWNFLKMALPEMPSSQPQSQAIAPAERRIQMPEPLQEKEGKLESKSQLNQIAVSQRSHALAEASAKGISVRQSRVPMDASLKIEEIGARRVPNLPADLTMENSGLPAFKPKSLQEVKAFVAAQRSRPVSAGAPLEPEVHGTAGTGRSREGRVSQLFSAPNLQLEGQSQGRGLSRSRIETLAQPEVRPRPKREILQTADQNKSAQIVGPLSQRKIIKSYIPSFPDWAKEQGVLEAFVSIRFYVSGDGRVLPDMVVERSSGYGALDRSAMETLKKWVFAPSGSGSEREWGIITFKYILE